jgi:hypothetical protein
MCGTRLCLGPEKMLEQAAESHLSNARFLGRLIIE